MRTKRLGHDRVHDQAGQDRPVWIGANDSLVDQLLDNHDHAISGECRLFLAAEQAPNLRVARGVCALGVDDRDIGRERRDCVQLFLGIWRLDRADEGLTRGRSVPS